MCICTVAPVPWWRRQVAHLRPLTVQSSQTGAFQVQSETWSQKIGWRAAERHPTHTSGLHMFLHTRIRTPVNTHLHTHSHHTTNSQRFIYTSTFSGDTPVKQYNGWIRQTKTGEFTCQSSLPKASLNNALWRKGHLREMISDGNNIMQRKENHCQWEQCGNSTKCCLARRKMASACVVEKHGGSDETQEKRREGGTVWLHCPRSSERAGASQRIQDKHIPIPGKSKKAT